MKVMGRCCALQKELWCGDAVSEVCHNRMNRFQCDQNSRRIGCIDHGQAEEDNEKTHAHDEDLIIRANQQDAAIMDLSQQLLMTASERNVCDRDFLAIKQTQSALTIISNIQMFNIINSELTFVTI